MFRYAEKSTKIAVIAVTAAVIVIAAGCFIAFHTVFRYNPEKTVFEISLVRENFLERSEIKIEGKELSYHGAQTHSQSTGSGVSKFKKLTDEEVREIFKYVVKKKMVFLDPRKFNQPLINLKSKNDGAEEEISEPPTDYLITIKYNNMEKTLGGEAARRYYKTSDLFRYFNNLAEEHFGSSYKY
ncbi:MAG: hypothetical protein R3232_12115 [Clostridia bacterium]|nr:hypothetical protein [Clostridia bacterium]